MALPDFAILRLCRYRSTRTKLVLLNAHSQNSYSKGECVFSGALPRPKEDQSQGMSDVDPNIPQHAHKLQTIVQLLVE